MMENEPSIEGKERRAGTIRYMAPTMAALVALLPFAQGLLSGHSFFFRDLAGQFYPHRLLALAGLLHGRAGYWNPFTHEGEPLPLLPLGYPVDFLQLLLPSEFGLSLVLALHLPFAALAFYALARHFGISEIAAAGGASVYALGGFALSSLNLYVHLQALAWSPLVVRGLLRAVNGTRRDAVRAAVPLGLALSTMGVEFVGQAILVGGCLAFPRRPRSALRFGLAVALGIGLAAYVLFPVNAQVAGSARGGAGFPTEVVLAHSVHPITLLQTLIAGLYGDPNRLTETFWGQNFFPRGFPYFLSLYLGAATLALALVGITARPRLGWMLAALAALGLAASLGRFAGLAALVDAASLLHRFRFPSKAFFTVHLVIALLASLGLDALARGKEPEPWRRLGRVGVLLFGLAALVPCALLAHHGLYRFLLAGFFPPDLNWRDRVAAATFVTQDALTGGAAALALAALARLAARGHLSSRVAAGLAGGLVAADLLRAGAGLNPMVPPSFYARSAGAEQMAASVREGRGRLYVVDPGYTKAYYAARAARGRNHERWSFAVLQETLTPDFNLGPRVSTALSVDRTMLVPEDRVVQPAEASPAQLPLLIPRLRAAAVSHVLSAEPLDLPDLELVGENRSKQLWPLVARLYRLRGSFPRIDLVGAGRVVSVEETTDRVGVAVDAESEATLVLRDPQVPGWGVRVDGREVSSSLHAPRYRAVNVSAGRHVVEFNYSPPGLRGGFAVSSLSLALWAVLLHRRRQGV